MRIGELPFSAAVAVVGILAAVGVFSVVVEGGSAVWPVGLVPAALWAAIYLLGYHRRPSAFRDPDEDDDFEDPVAEAARRDQEGATEAGGESEEEDDRVARFESDSPAHPPPAPPGPG